MIRPIHIVRLDKSRPALILTREIVRPRLRRITVAPITSTVRGLSTELPVGTDNGLEQACVVSCDNLVTVPVDDIGKHIGYLLREQEAALAEAIRTAFDLL